MLMDEYFEADAMRGNWTKALALIVALILSAVLLVPSVALAAVPEYTDWGDLTGKKVGLVAGAPFADAVSEKNPKVKAFSYYSSSADLILALRSGKIDAAVLNEAVGQLAINRTGDIAFFPEPVSEKEQGVAFPKGSKLHAAWNEIIQRMREDGTADALWDKWCSNDASAKTVPKQDWPGANGTLDVAACSSLEPCSYMGEGGEVLGYDIETLLYAAKELDYHLDFTAVEFSEIMSMVQAGKADMGCGSILISAEREEVVDFAPEHGNDSILLVRASEGSGPRLEFATIKDLDGKEVGMVTGGVYDQLIDEYAPNIGKIEYFTNNGDLLAALKKSKIDAAIVDEPIARLYESRGGGVAMMPEHLCEDQYGFMLKKDSPLTSQMNEAISMLRADGTLDALKEKWCGADEEKKVLPDLDWDTSAGTLRVVTHGDNEPMSYIRDGELVGYDIELAMLIAKELHMDFDISLVVWAAIPNMLSSEKADLAVGGASITDERKQSMDMTDPTFDGAVTFVVRTMEEEPEEVGLIATLKDIWNRLCTSFERTFVTENRWQMILYGLGTTIVISLLSGVFGTALGYLTVVFRLRGNRVVELLVNVFQGLMGRLPIVVVLMLFYYVVFGAFDLSGIVVAIVVFSLSFAASSGSIMWNAVRAVDRGQSEASLALGFNDRQTFTGVVLPQAAKNFMPLLRGQFVSLIKDTAIVGYIAVVDLTRAGDLIRSRTLEAFFPLIAVAAIYFALCCVFAWIINKLIDRVDYDKRPRRIKGVNEGA